MKKVVKKIKHVTSGSRITIFEMRNLMVTSELHGAPEDAEIKTYKTHPDRESTMTTWEVRWLDYEEEA